MQMRMQMQSTTSTVPTVPAIPAVPATRTRTRTSSLDSDSHSGSLSDSAFASSPSTPPTIDTAATSEDDEQRERHKRHERHDPHERHQKHVIHESTRMMAKTKTMQGQGHPSSNPNPNPSKPLKPYNVSCSSSLLRTTLLSFSFSRIGLSSSTNSPASSRPRSRTSSIWSPSSTSTGSASPIDIDIDTHSPTSPTSTNLHGKSTTELCTDSNPSLAQFSPTPGASSTLAIYSSVSTSTSRRHGPRSRSASWGRTAHAGTSLRPHPSAFQPDDRTSAPTDTVPPPFNFWRKRTTPHSHRPHTVHDASILPSISRAHVPDYVPDLVLTTDKPDHPSRSGSTSSPSVAVSNGFLKIDGSRDGLSFRTAENGTGIGANGANIIVGTPRPSYPIGRGSTDAVRDDEVAVIVDSPVADDDDDRQPNNEFANQVKGKGKERASIPSQHQHQHQLRVKIILPPPPVRASTTPLLKRTKPTPPPIPPTLMSIEQSSRLMRDRVHCATCATAGVDFPRCPRCDEAWCSRECRTARMDVLPDGRRKHVCKT